MFVEIEFVKQNLLGGPVPLKRREERAATEQRTAVVEGEEPETA